MKKLTLEIDALIVESFDAGADGARAGTVQAHATLINCDTNVEMTCGPYQTCNYMSCDTDCGTHCCVPDTYFCASDATDCSTCSISCYGTCTC